MYVVKRPGVDGFLAKMARLYEIVIYTASLSLYAEPLLNELDSSNIAKFRLYREHCTFSNNTFVKDLSALGRDLKNVIIVDNSPTAYAFQPENAIPITTWMDDMTDNKLSQLTPVLELLTHVDDVREYIKKFVQNNEINFDIVRQIFKPSQNHVHEEKHPLINTWMSKKPTKYQPFNSSRKNQQKGANPLPTSARSQSLKSTLLSLNL